MEISENAPLSWKFLGSARESYIDDGGKEAEDIVETYSLHTENEEYLIFLPNYKRLPSNKWIEDGTAGNSWTHKHITPCILTMMRVSIMENQIDNIYDWVLNYTPQTGESLGHYYNRYRQFIVAKNNGEKPNYILDDYDKFCDKIDQLNAGKINIALPLFILPSHQQTLPLEILEHIMEYIKCDRVNRRF